MKKIIFFKLVFLIIAFDSLVIAQNKINLRDVSFNIPAKFKFVSKENEPINYDGFYENGRIFLDSTSIDSLPIISYQYYENIYAGSESSESVLKQLNDVMAKDFKPDSLNINGEKDFSFAKYLVNGNTLFEIKSLGDKGWLNIAFVDEPKNDIQNLKLINQIINSTKHSREYRAEYKKHMRKSAESSKIVIVGLFVMLIVFFARRNNKNNGA